MRSVFSASMERTRPISLGIRIAVAGSDVFCRDVRRLLAADPDIAVVQELGVASPDESFGRIHALITEPTLHGRQLPPKGLGFLEGVSLVAVVGSSLGHFAGLANAQRFPEITGNNAGASITAIKERLLQLRFREFTGIVNALLVDQLDESAPEPTLDLTTEEGTKTLPVSRIDWIRAAGNHVEIRCSGVSQIYRSEMQTLEKRLPVGFIRIHRKVIINLQRLLRIDADSSVRQYATLVTGERFLISRHRRNLVQARWAELRGQSA